MAKYLDYNGMLYFWARLKERFASIGSAFTPKGSASTIPDLNTAIYGDVYNMSVEFTTTGDFVEGDGITHPAGTNIICVNLSGTKKWDALSGFVDLSGYSKIGHTHSDYVTYTYLGENFYTNKQIDDGFATATHTHSYAGSSSAGGAATNAINDEDGNNIKNTYATKSSVKTISDTVNNHTSSINTINSTFASLTSIVETTNKRIALPRASGTVKDYIVGEQNALTNSDASITVSLPPVGGILATREWVGEGYSVNGHNHDDRYYTETEMDTKLAGKSDSTHTHTLSITANEGSAPASYVILGFGGYYTLSAGGKTISFLMPSYSNAAINASGLMSAADKTKLNGIAAGATADTSILDSEIDYILAQ